MTSADDPDQIRREIERTQRQISHDVDLLTEKVTPGKIVERRVGRVRGAAGRWKDAVMGSDPPGTGTDPYGDPYGSASRDPYGPYAGADRTGTGGDGVRDIGRRRPTRCPTPPRRPRRACRTPRRPLRVRCRTPRTPPAGRRRATRSPPA